MLSRDYLLLPFDPITGTTSSNCGRGKDVTKRSPTCPKRRKVQEAKRSQIHAKKRKDAPSADDSNLNFSFVKTDPIKMFVFIETRFEIAET
jgi:hypothetical protein